MHVDARSQIRRQRHRTCQTIEPGGGAGCKVFRCKGQLLGPDGEGCGLACRSLAVADAQMDHCAAAACELLFPGHKAANEIRPPDEIRHEAVGWALVEIALAADLADASLGHHHETIRHGQRLFLVMCHHHGCQAEALLQFADFHPHLCAQLGIEVGQGLVQQKHVGPHRQRPGQGHTLLLSARECARQPVPQSAQPHHLQRFAHTLRDLRFGQLAHLESESDILRCRHVRKQRVGLEHKSGVAPPGRNPRHVLLADPDPPFRGRDEPRKHPQRRGLAAARRAKQHDELTLRDIESHAAHGSGVAVALGEILEPHAGHGQTTRARRTKRSVSSSAAAMMIIW